MAMATEMNPPTKLTHRNERDLFVFLVAGDALGFGIQHGLSINEELIMMMTMMKLDLKEPRAIGLPLHRVSRRVPIVEITNQGNFLGGGREADEVDGLGHFFGRVTVKGVDSGIRI